MEVEIIAIGNELLLGETVDTNSAYVARRLSEVGMRVTRTTHVGDDRARLADVLRETRGRSRWVIAMGGLGPTHDDITREAVAEVFGRPLRLDERLLAEVEARFRRFGYDRMPAANRRQAEVPEGARAIPNAHGSAPGLIIEDDATTLFVLPGVPEEMKALLEESVLPEIVTAQGAAGSAAGVSPEGGAVVRSRVVHTVGIGESSLAEMLDDLVAGAAPVEVAFLPRLGEVDVRLTLAGLGRAEADRRLAALAGAIADRSARWTYGQDEATLSGAIGEALTARGWMVGAAESCTGGELSAALSEAPGASAYFLGAVIAYANAIKESVLGVPGDLLREHGAVSEEVCRAMITGIREKLGADAGCAITGVAGPGGGTSEKPVGLLWCGVGTPDGTRVRRLDAPGSRAAIRRRASLATLALLLQAARGEPGDGAR